jgi:hypothetical protein
MVYVLSHKGVKLNEYRAHSASVMTIEISDDGSEFIGTCSIDGASGWRSRSFVSPSGSIS